MRGRFTLTPSWQSGVFFTRAEISVRRGASKTTAGDVFGPNGTSTSQTRFAIETGISVPDPAEAFEARAAFPQGARASFLVPGERSVLSCHLAGFVVNRGGITHALSASSSSVPTASSAASLTHAILKQKDWEVFGMDVGDHKLGDCLGHPRFKFVGGDITISREWIEYHVKKLAAQCPPARGDPRTPSST